MINQLFKKNRFKFASNLFAVAMCFTSTTSYALANACVKLNKTTDVAGHSCCILPPPETLKVVMEGTSISFSSESTITWLPLSGSIDQKGNISMQGSSTVAGFADVTTIFSGSQSGSTINGTFTLGAAGKLPEQQAIIYDVSIDTHCGTASACIGTFEDNSMQIIIDSDLTGTVTGPGLQGKVFAVNEYDTPGNVCFLSAIVNSSPQPCDIVVAGRLNVISKDAQEQGQFEFGGGNSCSGVIAPFTISLPKIK